MAFILDDDLAAADEDLLAAIDLAAARSRYSRHLTEPRFRQAHYSEDEQTLEASLPRSKRRLSPPPPRARPSSLVPLPPVPDVAFSSNLLHMSVAGNSLSVTEENAGGEKCSWMSSMPSAELFRYHQEAALQILVPGDYVMLQGKPFLKKSGWRKIAFFYNISFEIKSKEIKFDPSGSSVLRAEFIVRASMQSGRFADGWGSCDRGEKRFSKPNHDIPSTAETRSKTRACQDLLGIGDSKLDAR